MDIAVVRKNEAPTPLCIETEDETRNNEAIISSYNMYQEAHSPGTVSSSQRNPHATDTVTRSYRGFSTSISDMFSNPHDCCSLAFCGILQWDYNYYILTKQQPPSLWSRTLRHFFVPLTLFLAAGYCATRIQDPRTNELAVTILLLLLLVYVIGDCILERMKRIKFRHFLMDTFGKTHEQYPSDYYCAHRLCGCYQVDYDHIPDATAAFEHQQQHSDLCTTIFTFITSMCCGKCCGCWVQCCGVCAIAQEGREIIANVEDPTELLLDYITFEPFSDYFPKIAYLRITQEHNLWKHYMALSNLSLLMLKTLGTTIVMLGILAILDYQQSFTWENLLVFLATFSQAFIIIYFVHWKWHRFDLSLDAIVKYFASGFLLSTTLAIFFETVESIVINIFFNIIVICTSLGETIDLDDSDQQPNQKRLLIVMDWLYSLFKSFTNNHTADEAGVEDNNANFFQGQGTANVIIAIIYFFASSFLVAAFVEEMCKYYGFLVIDHPDMFQDFQVFLTNITLHHDDDEHHDEHDYNDDDSFSHASSIHYNQMQKLPPPPTTTNTHAQQSPISTNTPLEQQTSPTSQQSIYSTKRTLNSIGAGITISMVTVAIGFACCENLVYIFIYTGGGAQMEVQTLIARSLFPVHPLCAAIQSIRVCQHVLEKDGKLGVGQIITPALLLHGSFDFSLMLIAFFGNYLSSSQNHNENDNIQNDANSLEDDQFGILSFLLAFGIVLIGFIYYYIESSKQKKRLQALDEAGTAVSFL